MRLSQNLLLSAVLSIPISPVAAQAPAYLLGGEANGDSDFGRSVADAGDVDGDGYPDVVVGAPFHQEGGISVGGVFVYSGLTGDLIWYRPGENASDLFGWSLDGIGDQNGDGVSDIIVGAPLYDHTPGLLDSTGKLYLLSGADGQPFLQLIANQNGGQMGTLVRSLGDLTGDGIAEWAYASHKTDTGFLTDNGMVVAMDGGSSSLLWVRTGTQNNAYFGYSLDVMRATGAEATSRIIVGAPRMNNGGVDRGQVTLLDGFGLTINTLSGTIDNNWLGYAVSGVGDVDMDGFADYAASAPFATIVGQGVEAGIVSVYSGTSTTSLFTIAGSHTGANLGSSLSGFGDFDGDGVPDLLVGSPSHEPTGVSGSGEARVLSGVNGSTLFSHVGSAGDRVGRGVSRAGDLNLDGAGDLILGAYNGGGGLGEARVILSQAPVSVVYCSAKVNSQGCVPSIAAEGLASLSIANSQTIRASNVINQKPGLMLWGRAASNQPFFGGSLCVGPPIVRTPVQSSGGSTQNQDCSGSYSFHFSQAYMVSEALAAGDTIYTQYWSRDTAASFGVGLTDAVMFHVIP